MLKSYNVLIFYIFTNVDT